MISRAQAMTGMAAQQVEHFCEQVHQEAESFPEAKEYQPGAIL